MHATIKSILLCSLLLIFNTNLFAATVTIDASNTDSGWTATDSSRINGIDIVPAGGPVVINDSGAYTTASDVVDSGEIAFYSYIEADSNGQFRGEVSSAAFTAIGAYTQADFEWIDTFTNTGLSAANYFYNLNIDSGDLFIDEAYYSAAAVSAGGSGVVSYSLEVLLDGVSVWNSAASLSSLTGLNTTGSDIGGVLSTSGNAYSWAASSTTIDLGLVNAGSSADITYRMSIKSTTFGTPFGGAGTTATSRFGDPFSLSSVPNVLSAKPVNSISVPETGSLFLLIAGLFGLTLRQRNK